MREAIRFTFIISFIILCVIACFIIRPLYSLIGAGFALAALGAYDYFQNTHTILRNFPIIGHIRYLLEMVGPEIHQYFVESNTDGKPIDRNHRDYIYERAKMENETHPFGTELDINEESFNWLQHSIFPAPELKEAPRETIGGPECNKRYAASLFNISAMSFGSLSKNAVKALNLGAKAGNFYHNTGEGGISKYHLMGGDLVYEVGTGYFGCRTKDGRFSADEFRKRAALNEVKMIEIKLSQGAKPGHGGVLPAKKNNEEIAEIRGVKPHTKILSPPRHTAFSDTVGLLYFIRELRELSGGKPIGFKLAIGNTAEFDEICKSMVATGIKPDFITVDGAEGGTGAAPIDFSNYVGMPWEEALVFAVDTLRGYRLKDEIKIITATKIFTAYDILKALCIGADLCNSARGMMLALGCIQALKCDTNQCPTGVTTNNARLMRGLVVSDKWKRVKNYQTQTVADFLALLAASGCSSKNQLGRRLISKKVNNNIRTYAQLYPDVKVGSYLPSRIA